MAIADLYYLDSEGLHVPEYQTILDYLMDEYRAIYGPDIYLEADSKDYQNIAIFALALYDTMQTNAAVYNSFSPTTGTGDALTRNVAINGLQRLVPTYSTVDLYLTGAIGAVITNGYATDAQGRKWMLPATVTIGSGGDVTVTATAEQIGTVETAAATITTIGTPTRGWYTVNNVAAAVPGSPVETDAELRIRQAISTMFPSQSLFEGLVAAVAAVPGVSKYKGYENDTATPGDVSAHSIAVVVEGGDSDDIAEAIHSKKPIGCGTDGDVSVVVQDAEGNPKTINFYRPTDVDIEVEIALDAMTGWLTTTEDEIKAVVKAYIDALAIGQNVLYTKLFYPANLGGNALGGTFNITAIEICEAGGEAAAADITISFDELARLSLDDITINVST
ncbi:MAG: hypothetical protein FJ119_13090 [Deltaproteobacteria bacterium]|nr:hypothetical protein [Deltaproteobacteria bacterium]